MEVARGPVEGYFEGAQLAVVLFPHVCGTESSDHRSGQDPEETVPFLSTMLRGSLEEQVTSKSCRRQTQRHRQRVLIKNANLAFIARIQLLQAVQRMPDLPGHGRSDAWLRTSTGPEAPGWGLQVVRKRFVKPRMAP